MHCQLGGSLQFLEIWELYDLDQLIFNVVTKQELCDLRKTILLELKMIHKNDVTFVVIWMLCFPEV
jgi:hypothetical protein